MKKITEQMLLNQGACFYRVWQASLYYPKGIPVCWKCFAEAQQKGLPVYWLTYFFDAQIRIRFMNKHSNYGHLLDSGLKLLERKLLQTRAPKTDAARLARYQDYKRTNVSPPSTIQSPK